eukprot:gene54068-65935_t
MGAGVLLNCAGAWASVQRRDYALASRSGGGEGWVW